MSDTTLWITGLTTMLVGMGIVFSFLIILVFAINIMTKCINIINKLCPLPIEETKTKSIKKISDDSEIALAVAIAHRAIRH